MSIARGSINQSLLTWLLILVCLLGGWWGYNSLGRLEDPAFTIKEAVVFTTYPGASAEEVAREVSEPLEAAIQKMGEVDSVRSTNRPGTSLINVEMKSTYGPDELPGIWTKLRNRISDAERTLPQGASTPLVNDSFGDVFGVFYAVTATGFSDAEIHGISTFLRRELLAVDGVADVDVAGLPEEAIFADVSMPLAINQHIDPQVVAAAISSADSLSEAGELVVDGMAIRMQIPDGSDSLNEIGHLSVGIGGDTLNLVDISRISRTRVDSPSQIIRFDGVDAFTLGVAGLGNENIVEIGARVDARLAELEAEIPVGVELHPIYRQHQVVETATDDFIINLCMSVAIVVIVLALFMGWRASVVVGATLLLTVVGTLLFMALFSIEMERISLGALIIAMGMLVDNAIVVAEGMQMSMRRGVSSRDAAEDVGSKTQFPLLGATVIGIMAFAGIGLSPDATGEFLFSLFAVIGISLLLSWVLALTVTPLLGHYLFKVGDGDAANSDGYDSAVFRGYASVLRSALRFRWGVTAALLVVTVLCYMGFANIKQQFFPPSNTPMFFVHYKLPQGADIQQTSTAMTSIERWLSERDDVVNFSTFIGQGATRFILTYSPEPTDESYGHIIVRTTDRDVIPDVQQALEAYAAETVFEGDFRTERLIFGPGGGYPIEARFSGSDPLELRRLAAQAMEVFRGYPEDLENLRTDWHQPEIVLSHVYAADRAQTVGVTRDDIAGALAFATTGVQAGTLLEGERQIPIIARQSVESRDQLQNQVLFASSTQEFIPLEQVTDGLRASVQDTVFKRRDRVPTITVQAAIGSDETAAAMHARVREQIEAIELPIGYSFEWGGEFENSTEAQTSLAGQLPVAFLIMVMTSIVLFRKLRQPLIIWLLVPMSVNGVTLGLLGTGLPFSFTALLGLLSLSGMLIKNGIVLVEEIDIVRRSVDKLDDAIVEASVSRLRPVFLAAVTTILGMTPLLSDAFFASMAVTIMAGLAFASILTMIAAPVLYYMFFPSARKRSQTAVVAEHVS
ncbi:efflux RND transporter permease subunit [Granulosicoccus sp. 3-233]|uniref:efflux RND transporter permease subunit n=1 Tax=Granulosicoccus sp. 3-233 TaxID=3417969 RepID=UPI003D353A4B